MTLLSIPILHPTSPPLAGLLRAGHTSHGKLEALHAADRPAFDTADAWGQADFLRAQTDGAAAPASASPPFRGSKPGSRGTPVIQEGQP